jgi:hypothetical protein
MPDFPLPDFIFWTKFFFLLPKKRGQKRDQKLIGVLSGVTAPREIWKSPASKKAIMRTVNGIGLFMSHS